MNVTTTITKTTTVEYDEDGRLIREVVVTVEAVDEAARCRHCGQGPDPDGDHSCPCPHPDETCPQHSRRTA